MIGTEQDFWGHLRQSGLLADDEVAQLESRFPADTPLEHLAATLVSEGLLTSFQAKRVAAGDAKRLVLGQYRLTDHIGRGGFACVYKAVHAYMNRTVAIKVISPELAEDSRARTWFEREVHAVTQLCHPNIVMAYDANEIDGQFFMVMEFVDGMNLDAMVRHHGPLSARVACEMLQQAARGLQYAHEKGLVHRDIKPANLLVPRLPDAANQEAVLVKIADFGLARLYNNPANTLVLRNDKCFVGTPDYIAPEQARKVHEADIRSDLYSLGCSFYFALTGQRPFRGETPLETVMMHMEKEATPLQHLRPELPAALTAIVHKLMTKDPAKRFQTPADLAGELTFTLSRESSVAPDVGGVKKMTDRFPTIRPKTAVGEFVPTTVVEMPASPTAAAAPAPATLQIPTATIEVVANKENDVERMPDRQRFSEIWRSWTMVIDAIATGSRLAINAQQYRSLHTDLMAEVRVLAKSDPRYVMVERTVQPWLSLQSLTMMDRPTALSLQERCKRISRQLGVAGDRTWLWLALFSAAAVLAAVVGFALQSGGLPHMPSASTIYRTVEANPIASLAVVIPVAVLCSFMALGRFFRSR